MRKIFTTLVLLPPLCGLGRAQGLAQTFGRGGTAPFALLRQEWVEDVKARRLLSTLSYYAADASVTFRNGKHFEGIQALRVELTADFTESSTTITMTSQATGQSGELAYDAGSYQDRLSHGAGAMRTVQGHYRTMYRHVGALRWEIVQQAWSEAPNPK